MGDHEHGPVPLLEKFLQPRQPGEVEVVARLVQDEEGRAPHERPGEGQDVPLAAGHRLDGPPHDAGQTQTLQQALDPAWSVIATHRVEGVARALVGSERLLDPQRRSGSEQGLLIPQPRFHRVELLEDVVRHRHPGGRVDVLGHEPHPEPGSPDHGT